MTKYHSYKSIPITPKEKNFRTKTKLKNNSFNVREQAHEKIDDWFSRELIENEIYATEEDFD